MTLKLRYSSKAIDYIKLMAYIVACATGLELESLNCSVILRTPAVPEQFTI